MKYTRILICVGLCAFFFVAPMPHSVFAQLATPPAAVTEGQIVNPISYNSLGELIVAFIRFLLIMVGSLSVLFIIIGAVRMVTSAGNEKAVTAGKQTVQWAVLGLVVALMSFSIIAMVQSLLGRQ
ncbi:MAG: hypothetical protein JNK33_00785 [Candidatus Doudnabacteria bacterium]|nr:hypothetical protein [Candidatus Doudnabacteria bacterium]